MNVDALRRNGIQFLLIGAILNVLRWFIPGILQSILIDKNLLDDFEFCIQSDIYYFVGIFYIFYSILRQLKIQSLGTIGISIVTDAYGRVTYKESTLGKDYNNVYLILGENTPPSIRRG